MRRAFLLYEPRHSIKYVAGHALEHLQRQRTARESVRVEQALPDFMQSVIRSPRASNRPLLVQNRLGKRADVPISRRRARLRLGEAADESVDHLARVPRRRGVRLVPRDGLRIGRLNFQFSAAPFIGAAVHHAACAVRRHERQRAEVVTREVPPEIAVGSLPARAGVLGVAQTRCFVAVRDDYFRLAAGRLRR